jgi:hypothetical protein
MTTPDHDPYTALLDELAAVREHLTRLDTRETTHHATLTAQLAALTSQTGDEDTGTGYQPGLSPAWWTLTGEDRRPGAGVGGLVAGTEGAGSLTQIHPSSRAAVWPKY